MARLLDPVSQRRAALYLFLLCQGIKVATVVHASRSQPALDDGAAGGPSADGGDGSGSPQQLVIDLDATHLAFWCLLDLLYFVLLRWARIPWLTLSMCGTATVVVALCGVNTGVVAGITSLFGQAAWNLAAANAAAAAAAAAAGAGVAGVAGAGALGAGAGVAGAGAAGLGAAGGQGVGAPGDPRFSDHAILNSSYIVGSHTVNVHPPTIAKLNPNGTVFCILDSDASPASQSAGAAAVSIPLLIKGIPPFKIDYEVIHPDTGKVQRVEGADITANDAARAVLREDGSLQELVPDVAASKLTKRRVGLYALRARSIGIYRLLAVNEPNGEAGKLASSKHAQVVHCPSAAWRWQQAPAKPAKPDNDESRETNFDMCIDDQMTASVQVRGVAPLTVMFIKRVGLAESIITATSGELVAVPDQPATAAAKGAVPAGAALDKDVTALVEASRVATVTIPVSLRVEFEQPHVLRIARVIDGLNNTIDYETQSRLTVPDPLQKSTAVQLEQPGDFFVVNGHAHPSARFANCNGIKIRAGGTVGLDLRFSGSAPFTVGLKHTLPDGRELQREVEGIRETETALSIDDPGSYVLSSVRDRFCSGTVQLPSTCLVQQVLPPSMTLSSEPIEEKCLGAVGTKINMTFTGEPPFWVDYIEEHTPPDGARRTTEQRGRVESRRDLEIPNILKPRHAMTLAPEKPGMYRYVFTSLGDANFPEGVDLEGISITQIIHPHSSAQFVDTQTHLVRCIGDSARLKVAVQGSGPWVLVYYVVHNDQRLRSTKTIPLGETMTEIVVEKLDAPGTYLVDLVEITDGNGCTETLGSKGLTIEVLPQRPTVNFKTSKPVYIVEGKRASLPISVTGRGPFEITYRGANSDVQISRNGRDLEIFGSGMFELLGVRDAYCTGHAVEPRSLEVIQIPKPSLTVAPSALSERAVCQDSHDGLALSLSGQPPFIVTYEHTHTGSDGKSVTTTRSNSTHADTFLLSFDTARPGHHVYRIVSISDSNYPAGVSLSGMEIRRRVHRPPTAAFERPGEQELPCASSRRDPVLLGVRLVGIPPFHLLVNRKHDSLETTLHLNATLDKDVLKSVPGDSPGGLAAWSAQVDAGKLDVQGRYTFTIASVTDGTGCAALGADRGVPEGGGGSGSGTSGSAAAAVLPGALSAGTPPLATTMTIRIADQAKIMAVNYMPIVCVGDLLTYHFQGTPPFSVGYTWNGVEQADLVLQDPMMTLWAGMPGQLTITKVCNSMKCCDHDVAKDETMHVTVKALPRAIVDGGQDMVDDIREGDESEVHVEFVGEPPFSFTYTHTKGPVGARGPAGAGGPAGAAGAAAARQIDSSSQTVFDVMDHQWSLATSQEGVFRVTAVHDKYCGYPRIIQTMQGANAILK
nr:hypothetical protein HK105_003902 [Polyrhizophydium stewartii]